MCVRIGRLPPAGLLAGHRISGAESAFGLPVTWANPRLIGPLTFAAWSSSGPPGRPFLPAAVAAFASGPAAALGVPAGPMRSRKLRPLAKAARSLTVGSARDSPRRAHGVCRALGLLARCAHQARGGAVLRGCRRASAR